MLITVILGLVMAGIFFRKSDADGSGSSARPERIVLTWQTDPATSQAVTWRTDSTVTTPYLEYAVAIASPRFVETATRINAKSEHVDTGRQAVVHHSVNLTGLRPKTLYAYRVGNGDIWSEWFQFRTASDSADPFSFVYFGDAQNDILSMWSRTIRMAFADAPRAGFFLHAGDLVNRAESDPEWGEWFGAGGWIHATIPCIPVPGNHEYVKTSTNQRHLSRLWQPHFTLPENGSSGAPPETNYYIDFQRTRIIALNSNEELESQRDWLDKILAQNDNRWVIATFHHPVFSSAKGRDNKELRALWKPLFDTYGVDIVLQGHDHSYARGQNLPGGVSSRDGGTMYVVSVSGPKMYRLTGDRWMDRAAEDAQLYQVITIAHDTLRYQAMTATGDLYDAFDLVKTPDGRNLLIEKQPDLPELRMAPD